jgi:hypothetical protein
MDDDAQKVKAPSSQQKVANCPKQQQVFCEVSKK